MSKLYDEEGNPVEALTPEEVEAKLKETAEPLKAKLKNFEDREYNWQTLKHRVEKKEDLTEKEQEVYEREKALREKEESFQEKVITSWRERTIGMFSEGDKDLAEKIKFIYDSDLSGLKAETEEEIQAKVRKAYIIAAEKTPKVNPVFAAVGARGSAPPKEEKSYADSEEGQKLAELMGLKLKEEKK
jgi:hypothetical protein